jgi:hypothetical protein
VPSNCSGFVANNLASWHPAGGVVWQPKAAVC